MPTTAVKDELRKHCQDKNPENKQSCFDFLVRDDIDEHGTAEAYENEKNKRFTRDNTLLKFIETYNERNDDVNSNLLMYHQDFCHLK